MAIDVSRIPELTAEDLEPMTADELREDIARWKRLMLNSTEDRRLVDGIIRDLETELRMKAAPRTESVCYVYGIPYPNMRQMDRLGAHLLSLPRKAR